MRESVKTSLSLVVLIAVATTMLAWCATERPREVSPWLRFGSPVVGLLAFGILLKIHLGKDLLPDFLHQIGIPFFERKGFCFAIVPTPINGICWMRIYYQNRHERSCVASLVIKPSFGFFQDTGRIETLDLTIDCGPAAFGEVRVPWPIPEQYQGTRQKLDVGATVRYLHGRGRTLRYRNGVRVGGHRFRDNAWVHLVVTLCTFGTVHLSKPAAAIVVLPDGVASVLPESLEVETRQIWQLGDKVP